MKFVFTLLVLFTPLACSQAFASGKISLQNNFPDGGKAYRPLVGFSVYEPVTKYAALNFWTGFGQQFVEEREDVNWLVTKGQVDIFAGKFTIAPGVQFKKASGVEHDVMGFVRIDYKLW